MRGEWFTLCRTEKTTMTTDYQLVPIQFPSHVLFLFSSTVAVGSEIYLIGGPLCPSTKLVILDTRFGQWRKAAVVVVDGKIYVIGGCDEEVQVEVFDPKSRTWEFAAEVKLQCISRLCVPLERKIYMVEPENGRISVYDPREGRIVETTTTEMLCGRVISVCVVENVLYAYFVLSGLMWFDTKLKVWRRLVDRDGKELFHYFYGNAMAEYEGKLAVLWSQSKKYSSKKEIRFGLIALDRVEEGIHGRIQWSGIVATVPSDYSFLQCLVFSED